MAPIGGSISESYTNQFTEAFGSISESYANNGDEATPVSAGIVGGGISMDGVIG